MGALAILIRASKLLGAEVFDSENKKLGILVNVVFNTNYLNADLLIFPDEKKSILNTLLETFGDVTLDYLKEKFPAEYSEIPKEIIDRGAKPALEAIKKNLKQKKEKEMKLYYRVPLHEMKKPGQGKIKKIYVKQFRNKCPLFTCEPDKTDEDFPFFKNRSFHGLDTLLPTTLYLEPVQGLSANLSEKKGRITGLELDIDGGSVETFVARTYGKGAGEHLVPINGFNFSELKAKQMTSTPNVPDNP